MGGKKEVRGMYPAAVAVTEDLRRGVEGGLCLHTCQAFFGCQGSTFANA